jgi:subtilisin family serine protease/putative transposon-encoded protein
MMETKHNNYLQEKGVTRVEKENTRNFSRWLFYVVWGGFLVIFISISLPVLALDKVAVIRDLKVEEKYRGSVGDVSQNVGSLKLGKIKEEMSLAQKKLSTDLLCLLEEKSISKSDTMQNQIREQVNANKQITPLGISAKIDKKYFTGDMVYVYINMQANTSISTINAYVYKIEHYDPKSHKAAAWVKLNKLEDLALLSEVRSIRTVFPPIVRRGSVTSQGDIIHMAEQAREQYGYEGTNVKIGVISDGVDNRNSAIETGDLPNYLAKVGADEHVLSNTEGGAEGTAMLEIIHDLAPGAELYFHDCSNNILGFNAAVDALVAQGCQIIVDDIGWPFEPFFEDGVVAQHITSVVDSNPILYISAAGNDGVTHYQGRYTDDGDGCHDFSYGTDSEHNKLYVKIPHKGELIAILQWDDKFGEAKNDYDLGLFNISNNNVLAASIIEQKGEEDPLEYFYFENTTGSEINAYLNIEKYSGVSRNLEIYLYPISGSQVYIDNLITEDSIYGHAAVSGVITVGAINQDNPDNIAAYSSRGPVTLISENRNKPDVCGIDGVNVTGVGSLSNIFYGTSAAASHIAALASLLMEAYPEKTPEEIRDMIMTSAIDLGEQGYDFIYGFGRANVFNAFPPPTPVVTGVENGETYETAVLPMWEDPEGVTSTATLSKDEGEAIPYLKGTTISEDGNYVLTVTAVKDINCLTNITVVKFSVDTLPLTVSFSPINGATKIPITSKITITFNKAVKNLDDSEITDVNVNELIIFKESDKI